MAKGKATKGYIQSLDDIKRIDVLSTGVMSLDLGLGIGGIPIGRIIELYGSYGLGKSALTYYTMKSAARSGYRSLYIDLEKTFDPAWANRIAGITSADIDYASPPPNIESLKLLEDAIKSEDYKIIVFDTLASLIDTKAPAFDTQDIESIKVGGSSGMISHGVKYVNAIVQEYDCSVIFLNQVRAVLGAQIPMEDSPGGNAKDHFSSIRIHLRGSTQIKEKGEEAAIGQKVVATIKKNKVAVSGINEKISWNFYSKPNKYGVIGIDLVQDMVDMGINFGVIEKRGGWYDHPSFGKTIQGEASLYEFIQENESAKEAIRKGLQEVVKETYKNPVETVIDGQ